MRESLFRGKRVDDGMWVEGSLIQALVEESREKNVVKLRPACFIRFFDGSLCYEVEEDTVGQYTGLKDRNGKEIFEGDIVLKKTYNGKKLFPVTFGGGMFHCGFGGGSSTALHRYSLEDRQIEVVGNIHDNPDLIDGGWQ